MNEETTVKKEKKPPKPLKLGKGETFIQDNFPHEIIMYRTNRQQIAIRTRRGTCYFNNWTGALKHIRGEALLEMSEETAQGISELIEIEKSATERTIAVAAKIVTAGEGQ